MGSGEGKGRCTTTTGKLFRMLNWTAGCDVIVFGKHVFRSHYEIPDVIEGGMFVWWIFPERMGSYGTEVLLDLMHASGKTSMYSARSSSRTSTAARSSAVGRLEVILISRGS